jgi:hypothetical protein
LNSNFQSSESFHIGLSDGKEDGTGEFSDTYGIEIDNRVSDYCHLSGKKHRFKWQKGAIKPEWNNYEDVSGCGILLDPKDNVAIFFTLNGILLGKSKELGYKIMLIIKCTIYRQTNSHQSID